MENQVVNKHMARYLNWLVIKNENHFELYSMNPNIPIERKERIIVLGRVIKSQSENAFD